MANERGNLKTQMDHILYSKNVVHKYSPAIGKIFDMYVDYIPLMVREYKAGKNIIWNLGLLSDPTICYGNGAVPAAYTELGRLGAAEEIAVAQDHFQIPVETCSMVKANLGEFFLYSDRFPKKITYSSKDCEPYNMIFEILKDYGYDIHLFDIGFHPGLKNKERTNELLKHYREEVLRKIEWISGTEPDLELMHQEQVRYNRIQQKLKRIIAQRFKHPTYLGSLAYMIMMIGNGHYFGRPEEYEATIDELLKEFENLNEGEYHDEKVVLGWYGARGQEFNVFETVDEAGGAILAFSLPNDPTTEYDLDLDPIDATVKFDLCGKGSLSPNERSALILKNLHDAGAKGILLYGFLGCSVTSIQFEMTRKYLQEHKIPSLNLIGSFDVGAVTGQVTTRIQAFIEMLEKENEI